VRSCSWSTGEFDVGWSVRWREGGKLIVVLIDADRNVISGVAGYNADANSLVSYARNAAQVSSYCWLS
jgi:hypothetical protein